MKFFTPEFYLRFNSPDPAVAAKAHDEWEQASERDREHITKISSRLNSSTRELAETLCLHDAEYVGMTLFVLGSDEFAMVGTRYDQAVTCLVYLLDQAPLIEEVKVWSHLSSEQAHWLYDEFDIDEHDRPEHRILLSNGRVVSLRFYEARLIEHERRAAVA